MLLRLRFRRQTDRGVVLRVAIRAKLLVRLSNEHQGDVFTAPMAQITQLVGVSGRYGHPKTSFQANGADVEQFLGPTVEKRRQKVQRDPLEARVALPVPFTSLSTSQNGLQNTKNRPRQAKPVSPGLTGDTNGYCKLTPPHSGPQGPADGGFLSLDVDAGCITRYDQIKAPTGGR